MIGKVSFSAGAVGSAGLPERVRAVAEVLAAKHGNVRVSREEGGLHNLLQRDRSTRPDIFKVELNSSHPRRPAILQGGEGEGASGMVFMFLTHSHPPNALEVDAAYRRPELFTQQ